MRPSIVVAGMACRYPDAPDPGRLWENVLSRRQAFRPIPPERLPLHEYGGSGPDSTYASRAAVLTGWTFDRSRFRVAGDVFRSVDLTHWLALEVAADALADAGCTGGAGLPRDRVGVVVGNSLTGEFSRSSVLRLRWPYVRRTLAAALAAGGLDDTAAAAVLADAERRYKEPFPEPSDEMLAGGLANTIAGRICNFFDFHGTGYTVDGACASSLLAVATGAQALADDTLDVVVAGGVDLSLDPFELVGFARLGALATDGMRVYDAAPTGFLPGEGCGMVVLAREEWAVEHGLRVYARLAGWGTSSDGAGGLTRPEPAGQLRALRRAYPESGFDPGDVGLIEGHGTGTAVGDTVELEALATLRGGSRPASLGTVKANIGHTKAAAGVAGFIKAVLAVHHQVVPPTTGCRTPHPLLTGADAVLRVPDAPEPWPDGPRVAAVSAFGFGGINAHAVVAGVTPTVRRRVGARERRLSAGAVEHEVVAVGAESVGALTAELSRLRELAAALSDAEVTDLAAASSGSEFRPFRFAAAVSGAAGLRAAVSRALDALAAGHTTLDDPVGRVFLGSGAPARIGLLCSGQAAPVYPDDGALGRLRTGTDLPGRPPMTDPARIPDTAVAQPAIVRSSLAGLDWLDTLGVTAEAAVGHSLGEITALCWAGALTPGAAYRLAEERGAAMAAVRTGPGAMAGLGADPRTVRGLLPDGVVIAAENGSAQTVASGPADGVDLLIRRAADRGLPATRLPVSHAFHSPLMAGAADDVTRALHRAALTTPRRPVISTVTGDWHDADTDLVAVLRRQLTAPVTFDTALTALAARCDLLIEVGPGVILTGLATSAGHRALALDSGAPGSAGVATVTAALFASGAIGSVAPYAVRFSRPLPSTWTFLTNPCEQSAPVETPAADPRPAVAPIPALTAPALTAPALTAPALTASALAASALAAPALAAPTLAFPAAGFPGAPTAAAPVPAVGGLPAGADLLEYVIGHVATVVELDRSALGPDTRLVADLHLTSLRVSRIAADLARALGRAVPLNPPALATSDLAGLAESLRHLPEESAAPDDDVPPGVDDWVRVFADRFVPAPAPSSAGPGPTGWHIIDTNDHPLADAIDAAFPRDPAGARLLALSPGLTSASEAVAACLTAAASDPRPLLVVHHGGVGAAVGRSVAVELPGSDVLVVETPPTADGIAWAAAAAARVWTGFHEIRYGEGGQSTIRVSEAVALPPRQDDAIPLADGEVCLVTGGVKGIAAECAAALAEATGAVMVLLGRTPADAPDVRAGLDRISARGVKARYVAVDVTDATCVAAAVAEVVTDLGPVRGLLHAAGTNTPRPLAEVTAAGLDATTAPKVTGLDNLVAALDLPALRFGAVFGSVIGRTGLAGQAEYAIANEHLSRRCAELAAAHPRVRWLDLQWSVWSGTGMGVTLGVLDGLVRRGIQPIPVDKGCDILLRLLAVPKVDATGLLIAGRLPDGPTLLRAPADVPAWRFLERIRTRTPEVELIAEAELSTGSDPCLSDHVIDGVPVLPAVLGLEAMVQTARAVAANPEASGGVTLTEVELSRPVSLGADGRGAIRTAALLDDDGSARLVLRAAETGYAADHFRAVLQPEGPPAAPVTSTVVPGPLLPAADFYGPLFFHGPGFQRVRGYHGIGAYRCTAVVDTDPDARWFGAFHDRTLLLGDPGVRDACLHLLQACLPDRRVLPTGADTIRVYAAARGPVTVDARQVGEEGDRYVFDLRVVDTGGRLCETWEGLALRGLSPLPWTEIPYALAGAHLARRLAAHHPGVDLAVLPADLEHPDRSTRLADWLSGRPGHRHDAAGALRSSEGNASASHLRGWMLCATGPDPIGVDWEPVTEDVPLDPAHRAVAAELQRRTSVPREAEAATRVWTAVEALRKLGASPTAPLTLDGADGDVVQLRSGGHVVSSCLVRLPDGPAAVALGGTR